MPLHSWLQDTHCMLLAVILAIVVNSVFCWYIAVLVLLHSDCQTDVFSLIVSNCTTCWWSGWRYFIHALFHLYWLITGLKQLTLIYFLCSFIKAKSDVSLEDVSTLVEIGLELFIKSQNKLYAQVIYCFFERIFLITY